MFVPFVYLLDGGGILYYKGLLNAAINSQGLSFDVCWESVNGVNADFTRLGGYSGNLSRQSSRERQGFVLFVCFIA